MSNSRIYKGIASICAREIPVKETKTVAHTNPIYATTAFVFKTTEQAMHTFKNQEEGFIYSRWGNPTVEAVEKKLAALEAFGLEDEFGQPIELTAKLFSSGMGAIYTLMHGLLKSGDKILAQGDLYGGTNEVFTKELSKSGIDIIITDLQDLVQVANMLETEKAFKVMYVETPANPTMKCYDLEKLGNMARLNNMVMVVDNTFSTPLFQQPFKYGADFVVHSTTKYLNGHANSIGGVVIGRDTAFMTGPFQRTSKLLGANSNAFDAFLLSTGLKTLALRMKKHSENGRLVAEFLQAHPAVKNVNYIGLGSHPDRKLIKKQMNDSGGMLSFELMGGFEAGVKFMNNLKFCSIAATLGTIDTILQHPASMTHAGVSKETRESYGITDSLIRISTGIEDAEDIIGDLEQALG